MKSDNPDGFMTAFDLFVYENLGRIVEDNEKAIIDYLRGMGYIVRKAEVIEDNDISLD